ncbi:MAG: hypothetical protein U9P72_02235 [Campylobacterota bacterium]|nr:hypothetical protein [Campylobacterota bacterium]
MLDSVKNKTWQKIGEVLLDYSKILVGVGVIGPLINNIDLNTIMKTAIIIGVLALSMTGFIIYNKGVQDE